METVQTYTLDDMRAVVREYSERQGRAPQVGVMGSAADLGYSELSESYAREIGSLIGRTGATLIFGAEKTEMSLSTEAGKAARKAGGTSVGITYRKGRDIFDPESASIVISTVTERGGMREAVLAQGGSDGIISIGGGTGTLTELATAYQTGSGPFIPLVGMAGTGGTTETYLGKKLDVRPKRAILEPANSPNEAVGKILERILQVLQTGEPVYPNQYQKLFQYGRFLGYDLTALDIESNKEGFTTQWTVDGAKKEGITILGYEFNQSTVDNLSFSALGIKNGEYYVYQIGAWRKM